MNLNSRKLSSVTLHESYHLFPVGVLTSSGNNMQSTPSLTLDMTKVEGGVLVKASRAGKSGEAFVPDANCRGMTLIGETKPK